MTDGAAADPRVSGEPRPREPVIVARLLRPVGLRGAVKAESWSDAAGRFHVGAGFWIMAEPPVRVRLAGVSGENGGVLTLRFQGRTSVDEVKAWRGCDLAIEASERAPLTGDCFYYDELKGMVVATEAGLSVGVVRELWSTGPYDLLVINGGDGVERLLPMVRDFIVSIDRVAGRVTVRPPNGWLDDAAV